MAVYHATGQELWGMRRFSSMTKTCSQVDKLVDSVSQDQKIGWSLHNLNKVHLPSWEQFNRICMSHADIKTDPTSTSKLLLLLQQAAQSDSSLSSQSMHLTLLPTCVYELFISPSISKKRKCIDQSPRIFEWDWKSLGHKTWSEVFDRHWLKLAFASNPDTKT